MKRIYDKRGQVKHEFVLRNDTLWVERQSTLSSALASRTMGSFLVDARTAALLSGDSIITGAHTQIAYDSTETAVGTISDTMWVNCTAGVAITTQDSGNPALLGETNAYATAAHAVDNIDSLSSGVQFMVNPDTYDEVLEISFDATDLTTLRSMYAEAMGGANLRQASSWRSGGSQRN